MNQSAVALNASCFCLAYVGQSGVASPFIVIDLQHAVEWNGLGIRDHAHSARILTADLEQDQHVAALMEPRGVALVGAATSRAPVDLYAPHFSPPFWPSRQLPDSDRPLSPFLMVIRAEAVLPSGASRLPLAMMSFISPLKPFRRSQ